MTKPKGGPKPLTRLEVADEVEHLLGVGESPRQVAAMLGRSFDGVLEALRLVERPDLIKRMRPPAPPMPLTREERDRIMRAAA
ncbi:hypothetical protein ACFWGP_05605 [Agromyces sp. NPDC127015]|uniref:hypothetical protein n=1 Tax=Agromyces sp. NPDC127015 TaxID=3347108 RepID=UPI0036660F37